MITRTFHAGQVNPPNNDAALIAASAALAGVIVTSLVGMFLAWRKQKWDLANAKQQTERDLRKHQLTLTFEKREAAYRELTGWVMAVADSVDDVCFDAGLQSLPTHKRNYQGICVYLHKGPLRLSPDAAKYRYLWSPTVAKRVEELRAQAVMAAYKVIVEKKTPDDEHGHEELEKMAAGLYALMARELGVPAPDQAGGSPSA